LSVLPDAAMPGSATVTHVVETSPADRAGLQPGDVLLKWGDGPVPGPEELARRVQNEQGPVQILIERDGRLTPRTLELPPRL
jgi:S1-C subfamily serine protease